MNRYRRFFATELLAKAPRGAEEAAQQFSGGRTSKLSELHPAEWERLLMDLARIEREELKPMRAKVIALLCKLGYVTPSGQPDYPRINEWCKSRTSSKWILMKMKYSELLSAVNSAEQFYAKSKRDEREPSQPAQ